MIGPTGVGKTEISPPPRQAGARRRSSRWRRPSSPRSATSAATSIQIIRDLAEAAVALTARARSDAEDARRRPHHAAEERVLDALLPPPSNLGEASTHRESENGAARQVFRQKLRTKAELDDTEIELEGDVLGAAGRCRRLGPPGMPASSPAS
jgi:ATP-dependent HslUV protease ATP-binding subunit HslU